MSNHADIIDKLEKKAAKLVKDLANLSKDRKVVEQRMKTQLIAINAVIRDIKNGHIAIDKDGFITTVSARVKW